jgi:hypothetical protein
MRYQSTATVGDIPVVSIAFGPDHQTQQLRGRAVGVIAVGDVAVGIIAVGAIAASVVAIGGLSLGVIGVGGLALGLVALGGLAIGGVAVGGLAIGVRVGGPAPVNFPQDRRPKAQAPPPNTQAPPPCYTTASCRKKAAE